MTNPDKQFCFLTNFSFLLSQQSIQVAADDLGIELGIIGFSFNENNPVESLSGLSADFEELFLRFCNFYVTSIFEANPYSFLTARHCKKYNQNNSLEAVVIWLDEFDLTYSERYHKVHNNRPVIYITHDSKEIEIFDNGLRRIPHIGVKQSYQTPAGNKIQVIHLSNKRKTEQLDEWISSFRFIGSALLGSVTTPSRGLEALKSFQKYLNKVTDISQYQQFYSQLAMPGGPVQTRGVLLRGLDKVRPPGWERTVLLLETSIEKWTLVKNLLFKLAYQNSAQVFSRVSIYLDNLIDIEFSLATQLMRLGY